MRWELNTREIASLPKSGTIWHETKVWNLLSIKQGGASRWKRKREEMKILYWSLISSASPLRHCLYFTRSILLHKGPGRSSLCYTACRVEFMTHTASSTLFKNLTANFDNDNSECGVSISIYYFEHAILDPDILY